MKILDKLNDRVAQEISITQLFKALTFKRIINIIKNGTSFLLSALFKKVIIWGVPPILNIEPTNICNLKCPLCATGSGDMRRPNGKMDFNHYKKVMDEISDKILYVTLYSQGEPYLHKQFNEFVAYAKEKGVYASTSTNAHYFTKENAKAVVASGLDSMIISLDGINQESYVKYRVNGQFDKVIEGIKNLEEAKKEAHSKTPYLLVQFLVMKHNEHEITDMKKLAKELGVDRLLVKTIQVMTFEEAQEWLPQNDKYRRYKLTEADFKVKQGTGICPKPWLNTLVDWDGQVVPCCFDKNADHPLGDVTESPTFQDIWKSTKYNNFRKRMLTNRESIPMCKNCNYGIGFFK